MAIGRRVARSSKWTRWIWKLRLRWRVRRHSWRILFYYNILAGCCAVGILLTFILHTLTSNASFFTNYRCGAVAKNLIRANFVAVMVTAGIMGLAALLTSRIIALFISHTLGEFKPTGHWMDRIGFVVKWAPWFISLCLLVLICICTINLAWILLDAKSWCSRRWSAHGLQAVKNCRAWFGGTAVCLTTAEKDQLTGSVENCNDGGFLESAFFLLFIPREDPDACSFLTPEICLLFKNYYSTLAVGNDPDWSTAETSRCVGLEAKGVSADEFITDTSSDLYRYLVIYTGLWCTTICALIVFFFYIKKSSHFESYFSQPDDKTNHYLLLLFRPFTPWNEGSV